MHLDQGVFGIRTYEITDSLLFLNQAPHQIGVGKRILRENVTEDGIQIELYVSEIISVCFTSYTCGTPFAPECTPYCDYDQQGGCSFCFLNYDLCFDYEVSWWEEEGGGGSGGGTGSGGGGGGTGGGGGWNVPSCGGISARSMLFESCSVGWVPLGGGGTEVVIVPPDPCDKVAPNIADDEYRNSFSILKGRTTDNFESGYVQYGEIFYYAYGPSDKEAGVTWHINQETKSLMHSHFSGALNIFSVGDLQVVYKMLIAGYINTEEFTFGVAVPAIANTGTPAAAYVFTIDDPAKFLAMGTKYFEVEQQYDYYDLEKLYKAHGIRNFTSRSNTETKFLKFLKEIDCGISILKANDDFTSYDKLTLNRSNEAVAIPCN